jgi:hypothetical protein
MIIKIPVQLVFLAASKQRKSEQKRALKNQHLRNAKPE